MQIDYSQLGHDWVQDTPEILAVWFDNPLAPTIIHFCHTAAYNLHKTRMPIPLASLKMIRHPIDGRTRAARKPMPLFDTSKQ